MVVHNGDLSTIDVMIVGAGPTGLSMAIELTRRGIRCRIIDKAPTPALQSRAIGIVSRTLEVFDGMGVAKTILQNALQLRNASVLAGKRRILRLTFEDLNSPYPFAAVLPQGDTERLLATHLADMGVHVEREVELLSLEQNAGQVRVRLRDRQGKEEVESAQWLVGCDGAHSAVRQSLAMPFVGMRYPEAFLLADVRIQGALPQDESLSFYHRSGQLLFFPLPDNIYRVVAILEGDGDTDSTNEPTLSDMQAFVDERGPGGIVLKEALWISLFRVSRRIVKQFRNGRVFLAGDAAHIHSPAGGQGMNTGIQDANNLAWKLALVIQGHSPEVLLDSYQSEREPVARAVLRTTDRFTRTATLRNPLMQSLRNILFFLLGQNTQLKHRMVENLAELTIAYEESPIVQNNWKGQPKAGTRAPDGPAQWRDSRESVHIYELLRDTRHIMLSFLSAHPTQEDHQHLNTLAQLIHSRYHEQIAMHFVITSVDALPQEYDAKTVLLDTDGSLHQRYGATTACIYLLRPDGYIGFRGKSIQISDFRQYLDQIFIQG